jgi:hypothetical protein
VGSSCVAARLDSTHAPASQPRFEALYKDGGTAHLVTELAAGGDLLGTIREAQARGAHLEEDQVMAWLVQVRSGRWLGARA